MVALPDHRDQFPTQGLQVTHLAVDLRQMRAGDDVVLRDVRGTHPGMPFLALKTVGTMPTSSWFVRIAMAGRIIASWEAVMMTNCMQGMGWGMGLFGLLTLIVLVLAIAALVKYLWCAEGWRTRIGRVPSADRTFK
nr:hypothetical protein [Gluconobacter albidus]